MKSNIETIRNEIKACKTDMVFVYNGLKSGVTSEVTKSIPTFQAWHGDKYKYYKDVDDVISDKFYSGKSLTELADIISYDLL